MECICWDERVVCKHGAEPANQKHNRNPCDFLTKPIKAFETILGKLRL